MAARPALLDRTVEEFRRTLTEIGGQPSSADDAEALGRRAAMVVLAGGAWERALGELLTSAEARVLLAVRRCGSASSAARSLPYATTPT